MVDRRRFMQSSLAFYAALAAWEASGSSRRAAAPIGSASIVLVDRYLAGSTGFAADARLRDLDTLEFAGDVGGLWMREIEPRLRAGPVTIAGYTSAATLFCLDLLARDYGARTVERVGAVAVSWIIASTPGRCAPLAPAAVRLGSRRLHA
jgi:hypothetical protein